MPRPTIATALVLGAVLGCAEGAGAPAAPVAAPSPAAAIAEAAPATPAAPEPEAAAPPDAAPPAEPASVLALLRTAAVREPSGAAALAPDGETVVDPASSFDVELGAPVPQVRLVLLDAQDAHVAAKAAREIGDTTRLSLAPSAPLVPGGRYALRLEGLSSRELRDARGRAFEPHQFVLLAAGTPPPPEPATPSRRRRR